MNKSHSPVSVRVEIDEEMRLITFVLRSIGVPAPDAEVQAVQLVEADRRGYGSHGIQRLPLLVRRIEKGLVSPIARPSLDWRSDSVLAVDGNLGLGPVVAMRALEHAASRVKETGAAVVAISNTNHLGMLAPYVEWITDRALVGVALTTSEALVHAWGGRRAIVGTNPVAIGVPARPHALVIDLATGVVSMGRILRHRELGIALEPGWAVDAAGQPTLDPAAALGGAISPFGGAKGFALGLALEVLVAALTRSALGRDVVGTLDAEAVCNKGDLFLCIDPDVMAGSDEALDRISRYLEQVREEPPQEGFERVRLPGERAFQAREESAYSGVELPASVWNIALDLADALSSTTSGSTAMDIGLRNTGHSFNLSTE